MAPRSIPDWTQASPEEIEESIVLTRARLDRHLEQLRGKFAPKPGLRRIGLGIAIAAGGLLAGAFVWRLARRDRHPVQARITRLKVRSAGMGDRVRALRLLLTVIRKGKPAVFIVDPGKR